MTAFFNLYINFYSLMINIIAFFYKNLNLAIIINVLNILSKILIFYSTIFSLVSNFSTNCPANTYGVVLI